MEWKCLGLARWIWDGGQAGRNFTKLGTGKASSDVREGKRRVGPGKVIRKGRIWTIPGNFLSKK